MKDDIGLIFPEMWKTDLGVYILPHCSSYLPIYGHLTTNLEYSPVNYMAMIRWPWSQNCKSGHNESKPIPAWHVGGQWSISGPGLRTLSSRADRCWVNSPNQTLSWEVGHKTNKTYIYMSYIYIYIYDIYMTYMTYVIYIYTRQIRHIYMSYIYIWHIYDIYVIYTRIQDK